MRWTLKEKQQQPQPAKDGKSKIWALGGDFEIMFVTVKHYKKTLMAENLMLYHHCEQSALCKPTTHKLTINFYNENEILEIV